MIKLSKLADYAIVILAHMSDSQTLVSSSYLAGKTNIPEPTVSKIMKLLAKGSVVSSVRGAQGGYKLTKTADQISAETIISAIDGPIALTACVSESNDNCAISSSCRLNGRWQKINNAVRGALNELTLEDLR